MTRFIVLVWNVLSAEESAAARWIESRVREAFGDWQSVASGTGFAVWCPTTTPIGSCRHVLSHNAGVVLGTIFRRPGDRRGTSVELGDLESPAESARIVQSEARRLVDSYWGSFIAVVANCRSRKTWVMRSPLGHIGCFGTQYRGVSIHFSSTPDFATLRLLTPTVNWGYVARKFVKNAYPDETGLHEISRLLDGECLEISGGRVVRKVYWDLVGCARLRPLGDASTTADALRATTQTCVRSWAGAFPRILLRLSGGFDSSVVLGCLRDSDHAPDVIALNRYSNGADSDERSYARAAAAESRCELIELPRDAAFRIDEILSAELTESPRSYVPVMAQARPEVLLARTRGCSAIFSGNWGDELFFNAFESLAAADYVYEHGVRPALLGHALSAAHLESRSVWSILAEALAKGLRKHQWQVGEVVRPLNRLVNWPAVDALLGGDTGPTPWYDEARYVPPGRQQQICRLSWASERGGTAPFADMNDIQTVAPLLSQPIVETCLRTPSYVMTKDGWNRALARSAFDGLVPQAILRRRSKGGQELHTAEIFTRNLEFMRALIMNGHLASAGLLDEKNLASALSGGPSGVMRGMRKISRLVETEIWLRRWAEHGARVRQPTAVPGAAAFTHAIEA